VISVKHGKSNVVFHELIGLDVEVVEYPDSKLVGLKGRVLDETYKTLLIETRNGRMVRVLKEHGIFRFTTPQGLRVVVKGFSILDRPEDRLKNLVR